MIIETWYSSFDSLMGLDSTQCTMYNVHSQLTAHTILIAHWLNGGNVLLAGVVNSTDERLNFLWTRASASARDRDTRRRINAVVAAAAAAATVAAKIKMTEKMVKLIDVIRSSISAIHDPILKRVAKDDKTCLREIHNSMLNENRTEEKRWESGGNSDDMMILCVCILFIGFVDK